MNTKREQSIDWRETRESFRKIRTGLLFLLIAVIFSVMGVHAAEEEETAPLMTQNKLFTLRVKDGYTTQKIAIFEKKDADGKITYGPSEMNQNIMINMASGTVKLKVISKTAYFKKTKLTVSCPKSITVEDQSDLQMLLKTSKGKKKAEIGMKVIRPKKPVISKVSVSQSTFTPGYGTEIFTVDYISQIPVSAQISIKNSNKKEVYKFTGDMVTTPSSEETPVPVKLTWDGMPVKGNKANLPLNACVPDGTYKATIYLKYVNGKKTKSVKKTVSFKINAAAVANGANADFGEDWPWKMYITGNSTADYLAEVVCQEVLTPDMSEITRARQLFKWMAKNFKYGAVSSAIFKKLPDKMDKTSATAKKNIKTYKNKIAFLKKSKKAVKIPKNNYMKRYNKGNSALYSWGKNGLSKQVGDCHIIAQVYSILLGHAGISSDVLEHPNTKDAGRHFWNVVKIGDKWYMADADRPVENNGDLEDYRYFLRGTKFTKKNLPYSSVLNDANYKATVAIMNAKDCPGRKKN